MAFSKARRLSDFIAADGTIPSAKFASGTITSAHIADTSITHADLHTDMNLTSKTVLVANASTGDSDTTAANTAFVQQEIAALVDSSPSALNTLNELAAALGDDANFSTTVTNSIGTKLPLAGGTLTGALTINSGTANTSITTSSSDVANWMTMTDPSGSIFFGNSGANYQLWVGAAKQLEVTNGDAIFTGHVSLLADNNILRIGAGQDLRLFHDGTYSSVQHNLGSGGLLLRGGAVSITNNNADEAMAEFIAGGAVTIKHANATVFNTNSGGVDITGQIVPTLGIGVGDNAHWKIRGNTANVELVFEYATSATISDNNIKAKFRGNNFGIGSAFTTALPESLIHIKDGDSGSTYSTDGADKLIIEDNDSVAIDLRTPSANQGLIMFSDGTRGVGSIGYAHTNDQLNFKTGGAARFEIDSNGQLHAIYGFSRGAPFPHYYHKRSAQLQAGSSNKRKARVGRIYWTSGHWSAGGVSLHARVGSEYYSGENRLYHFEAQYTDSQVSYQLLESHSRHSNNTRIYLGAVTTAHTYSGQPCRYQDIWVEANAYKRIHVDFTSLGKSSGQQIYSSDITSGWGGVVVYDSLQDAADVSDFTDELINKDADHFITVSNKVNDTLNQNEYFGFNQIQSGSSLNFDTSTYKYKVPITGVYLFGANVYRNSSSGGNISFRKTDSAGNNADVFGRQPQQPPSGDNVIHLSQMKYCTKGDLVGVFNYGATFNNFYGASDDNFSSFYGHLIKSTM